MLSQKTSFTDKFAQLFPIYSERCRLAGTMAGNCSKDSAPSKTAKAKERFTPQQVIDAIRVAKGKIGLAARSILNCDVGTVYNYRDRYPEVAQGIKVER